MVIPPGTNTAPWAWGQFTLNGLSIAIPGTAYSVGTTSGSAVVTVANTTGLSIGVTLIGPGLSGSALIQSIVTNTSITMNNNATATASVTIYACNPQGFLDTFTRANTLPGNIGGVGWTLLDPYNGSTWPPATDGYISSNKFIVTPGGATIPGGGTATGVVYAWQATNDGLPIIQMNSSAVWTNNAGQAGAEGSIGMVMSAGANVPTQDNNIHVTYDRANNVVISYWLGGAIYPVYNGRIIESVQPNDGTTVVQYTLLYNVATQTVTAGINGTTVSVTNSAFNPSGGNHCCFELYAPPTGGNQPANQPAFTSTAWGCQNTLLASASTAGNGFLYRNITIPNDSNTIAIAMEVQKTGSSVFVGMASLLTGGTGVQAYFGFNTNTGVIDVNTNGGEVLDLGASWLGVMYVKNNTSGNTNIQVQFYPGGMSAFGHNVTGTANTGFFNVQLNTTHLITLVNTLGAAASRPTGDKVSIIMPDGGYISTYVFGDGTAPQQYVNSIASGNSGFSVPALNGGVVSQIIVQQ